MVDGKIQASIDTASEGSLFADLVLHKYPEEKTQEKAFSNKMNISRKIEMITDVATEVTGNEFIKGQLYKVTIDVHTDQSGVLDLSIEDHLPAGFRVINDAFQTESSAHESENSRRWYEESRPEQVFAHRSRSR